MAKTKLAVTIDSRLLDELDELVDSGVFANRSQAMESAVADKLQRLRRTRLARESAKLNPADERALADERMVGEVEWPEY